MLKNMTSNLILHNEMTTTPARAKAVRWRIHKVIRIILSNERQFARKKLGRMMYHKEAINKAIQEFPLRFGTNRNFTKIIPHMLTRRGDNAKLTTIQLTYPSKKQLERATYRIEKEKPLNIESL